MYALFLVGLLMTIAGIVFVVKKAFDKKVVYAILGAGVVLMFVSAPFIEFEDEEVPTTAEVDDEEEPEEPKELTLEEKVESIVKDKLGDKTNTKKDRIHKIQVYGDVVNVWLNSSENFTVNMTKKGMWRDTFNVLEELAQLDEVNLYQFVWMAELVDVNGNKSDNKIMSLDFPREVMDDINFDGVDYNNAALIADNYWEHNAIK